MCKIKNTALLSILLLAINSSCYADSAKLEQAYQLALSGDIYASDKLYRELLTDEQIAKHKVYLSKCISAINRLDLIGSDAAYNLAVKLLADNPNQDAILLEFNYQRAALLINKGESIRAAAILAPYVFRVDANVRMQSDYLDANFRAGDYPHVVKAAQTFWNNNYHNKPMYGVVAVADSLFKLKRYAEAQLVYQVVLENDANIFFANLSLAYCLAMLDHDKQALELYAKCRTLHPDADNILLNEAATLFTNGKKNLSQKLYKQLKSNLETKDKVSLAQAKLLADNAHSIASNQLLYDIHGTHSDQPAYLAQKFDNALSNELYYTAAKALKKLYNTPLYSTSRLKYINARKAGVGASFLTTSNYKGNSIQSYSIDGDVYIGLNTFLTATIDNTRLSDQTNTVSVTTNAIGLVHRFERGNINLLLANAIAGGTTHTLYATGINYKIDDLTTVGLLVGKRYIADSKAVLHNFITENYYTLSLERKINERNSFYLDYTNSSLSDSNHFSGYGLSYSYYPIREPNKTHEFYTYYNRSGFSKVSDYYEPPDKRLAYGLGWQARWTLLNAAYWLVKVNIELGSDNLDPTDLSPSIRIEYGYPLSNNQDFTIATEYGVRTNRMDNINRFLHGYTQLELKYNLSW